VIPFSDPNDLEATTNGDYSFLITFLDASFGCMATGVYTWISGDQVVFTASCSGLPFFSVTGGRGRFADKTGFVEFMIEVEGDFT